MKKTTVDFTRLSNEEMIEALSGVAGAEVFGDFTLMDREELIETLEVVDIASGLSSAAKEVLIKLRDKGPVYDGDVPSKSGRDELLECGAAVKVCVKGEQGYQACTYKGWDITKLVR